MYTKIFDKIGLMNSPLGIVAIYGKTLVKLYAVVSEVIIEMNAAGIGDAIKQALMEMACKIAKKMRFHVRHKQKLINKIEFL